MPPAARYRPGMRVLLLLGGVAVVAVAAIAVPLPWSVVDPADLRSVAGAVTIELEPELERPAGDPVSGEYLVVQHREQATALQLAGAALLPGGRIERSGPPVAPGAISPLVAATMSGLGIVARHADAADIPVTVRVDPGVDGASLGAALYAFDVGTDLDLAQGRRVVGLGRMLDGGHLACTTGVAESVVAAARQRVDVVVVPADCAEDAAAAIPHDSQVEVLDAASLAAAADALLAP